jgi:hypothetical protein
MKESVPPPTMPTRYFFAIRFSASCTVQSCSFSLHEYNQRKKLKQHKKTRPFDLSGSAVTEMACPTGRRSARLSGGLPDGDTAFDAHEGAADDPTIRPFVSGLVVASVG